MTTGRRKVRSTDKLPRIYGPDDPRAERGARLGAVRARATEEAAVAAQEAAQAVQEAVADSLTLTDFLGNEFPAAPVDGQPFVRTDLDCDLFVWDEERGKWLSYAEARPSYTNGTTLTAGNNLRLFQGPAGSGTLGYLLPWDCTLVDVVATRATSGSATQYDVRAGTTVMHSHTLGAGVVTSQETGLDVDFASGDVVNVILVSDMTGGGTITLRLKRRAT